MDRLYLVTGAAGHLGNTLTRMILERGGRVRALLLPMDGTKSLDGLPVEIYRGDICSADSLQKFFDVPDPGQVTVIHTAGIVSITSRKNPAVYRVNVQGTRNVADICVEKGIRRLVYVSSVHAIPEKAAGETISEIDEFLPEEVTGEYAKTKAEATQYVLGLVRTRGLDAVVVHPSGIIGPNDFGSSHMTQMILDYVSGWLTSCIRGGYDFVDVRDVAQGILSAAERGKTGSCYILSNHYFPVRELFDRLHEITGRPRIRTVLPFWFVRLTAPLSELYYRIRGKPPLFTTYSLYTLFSNSKFSHEKADRELGYTTRDIRQTLADTVSWLVSQRRIRVKRLHKI